MPVTDPIALDDMEDALWNWVVQSTGIDGAHVRVQTERDQGEARGPAPKATISLVSLVQLSQQGRSTIRQIMTDRYTVIADGPGEVGVDFYPGTSLAPQRISIVAGVGDPPATSAAALLVQLQADLPAGYTAILDPNDATAVLVTGSSGSPLFASATADAALLTVTTAEPHLPYFTRIECQIVWRVTFRADGVSGVTMATGSMNKAMMHRRTLLDPAMHALGFRHAGTPQATPFVPITRDESIATFDVAFIGLATGAFAAVAMRAAGLTETAA